jgi:hypothetical protein
LETYRIVYDLLVFLWPFGTFDSRLVYFVVTWHILSRFGIFQQEKYGNPGADEGGYPSFLKLC